MTDNKFKIPTDPAGFVSFQCPKCATPFKLKGEEVDQASGSHIHCPACGHGSEPTDLLSKEAKDQIDQMVMNEGRKLLDEFARKMNGTFKEESAVVFSTGRPKAPLEPQADLNKDDGMAVHQLSCCGRSLKVDPKKVSDSVYCPYCGTK